MVSRKKSPVKEEQQDQPKQAEPEMSQTSKSQTSKRYEEVKEEHAEPRADVSIVNDNLQDVVITNDNVEDVDQGSVLDLQEMTTKGIHLHSELDGVLQSATRTIRINKPEDSDVLLL